MAAVLGLSTAQYWGSEAYPAQPSGYQGAYPSAYSSPGQGAYPADTGAYPSSGPASGAYSPPKQNNAKYPSSYPKQPNYGNSRPPTGGYRPGYSPPLKSEVYISPVSHSQSVSPPYSNPYNTRGGPTYSTHTSQTFLASVHPWPHCMFDFILKDTECTIVW